MNSFSEALKKHGLIIWLSQFFAVMVTMGVVYLLIIGGVLTAVGIGIGSMYSLTTEGLLNAIQTASPLALGGAAGIVGLTGVIVYALAASFGGAGTIAVAADAISKDESRIQTFFKKGFENMWRVLGLSIVSILIYIPAMVIGAGAGYAFAVGSVGTGILLAFVTSGLALAAGLGTLFAQYILIIEKAPIWTSLTKSVSLLSKAFGHVLVTVLMLLGIALVVGIPKMVSLGIERQHTLFNPVYDFIVSPIVMALITLIMTYRYFKYIRPVLYPTPIEVENTEVADVVSDEMDKTEY